ncbi:hypothetical protein NKI94_27540 [Mesorhizobium australicum]|uniref:hypothetical protein n=1 Tax=Mesorhizobium australicum TaxID=536018 RepID=UPI0012EBEDCC
MVGHAERKGIRQSFAGDGATAIEAFGSNAERPTRRASRGEIPVIDHCIRSFVSEAATLHAPFRVAGHLA